jgi:hypothetical protein
MSVSPEVEALHLAFVDKYFTIVDEMDAGKFAKQLFAEDGTFVIGMSIPVLGYVA